MNCTTQILGFGPAALGIPVAADRLRVLTQVMRAGLIFLERQNSWGDLGRERLNFSIVSNSIGDDFISGIYPFGTFAPLMEAPAFKVLAAHGSLPVPLGWVTDLLRHTQDIFLRELANHTRSGVRLGTRVEQLRRNDDGSFTSFDQTLQPIVTSRMVVMATGGVERSAPTPASCSVLMSSQVLRRDWGELPAWIAAGRRVCIVGSSHSAYSVAAMLLAEFGDAIRPRQVTIVSRAVKLYYASMIDARTDNYGFCPADIFAATYEINKFDGLRGSAKQLYRAIVDGSEVRVCQRRPASGCVEDDNVVICALGYRTNRVRLIDSTDAELPLLLNNGNVTVNHDCEILSADGTPITGLFGLGLGYAPDGAQGGRQVGVNFFHGDHAERIVRCIMGEIANTQEWLPALKEMAHGRR